MNIASGIFLIVLIPAIIVGLVKAILDLKFYSQATKDNSDNDTRSSSLIRKRR